MGNWNMTITGVGCHHNGQPTDADAIAKEALAKLRAAGHTVQSASFTCGSGEDLLSQPQEG